MITLPARICLGCEPRTNAQVLLVDSDSVLHAGGAWRVIARTRPVSSVCSQRSGEQVRRRVLTGCALGLANGAKVDPDRLCRTGATPSSLDEVAGVRQSRCRPAGVPHLTCSWPLPRPRVVIRA